MSKVYRKFSKVYLMAIFRSEAQRLKKEGVEILIALGHAGYREVDLQMAGEVRVACPTYLDHHHHFDWHQIEELDLVVGGHSHTFLYSGPPPRCRCSIHISI